MRTTNRRWFFGQTMSAAVGACALAASGPAPKKASPNERVVLGCMGVGGRGTALARAFASMAECEIAWICDAEISAAEKAAKIVADLQNKEPKVTDDFRRMLDDQSVHAIINATPDHWHAPGTIFACQAGKDVYVEKPASYCIWEGRKMVEAARKYNRVVQLGTQTRSAPYAIHAVEYCRSGKLGDIHLVRVINMKSRPPVKSVPDSEPPKGFNYDLWLGPAPLRPYNRARVNNWNWYWDYSGGDIVNDGVHQMDLGHWVIGQPYPKAVATSGARFAIKDEADDPDTQLVTYEYDNLILEFSLTMWTPYIKKTPMDMRDRDALPRDWNENATRVEVYGTKGMMMFGRHGDGWQVFDDSWSGKPFEYGRQGSDAHFANFIECVKTRKRPNADIEEGHLSTLLCHLGNISYRVGNRRLLFDGKTERFVNDEEANRLLRRPVYREPYGIPETV